MCSKTAKPHLNNVFSLFEYHLTSFATMCVILTYLQLIVVSVKMVFLYINLKWTGLFMGDLKTKQESLVFVKRMMALAVSSITYIRGIFPEDAYRSRYIEGKHTSVQTVSAKNVL